MDNKTKLAAWAITVAAAAPEKRNRYTRHAYIPWSVVEGIRADLDAAGVDWRKTKQALEGRKT